jgi:ParB family chromosome partitioning protein
MAFNLADVLKDVSTSDTGREQIEYISLSLIDEDPNNFYQLSDLDELAANIAFCGLQQPIRVRQKEDGRYIIVSGHRRRAAVAMLAEEDPQRWQEVSCIVERDAVSPSLQQLRLIYANANTRKMSPAEISQQAEQVQDLLYQLKEEGYEFPGRMRDHVAEAMSISKSKLARLKVIRENLDESWVDAWKGGTLTESQAYELAQMPKYWQSIIKDSWGASIQSLYADRIRLFRDKFQELADIQCQHGLQLCEHSSKMMRKDAETYYNFPCNRCCFDCYSLQTCKDCCPEAMAKKKELKAVSKQANLDAKREQEERDRPGAEFARMVWDRIGKARERSGCSMESLSKARGDSFFSKSYDDDKQTRMESGQGDYSPYSTVSFGNGIHAQDMMHVVAVADALKCSVDYLLGRTDDRESHLSVPVQEAPVSYSGIEWKIGDPAENGRYILLVRYDVDAPTCLEDWDWDNDNGWQDEFHQLDEDLVEILGWIPFPKIPAVVHSSLNSSCITGISPSGHCGAAACCDNEHTCCLQCGNTSCNSRCGWIDDVAEVIEE